MSWPASSPATDMPDFESSNNPSAGITKKAKSSGGGSRPAAKRKTEIKKAITVDDPVYEMADNDHEPSLPVIALNSRPMKLVNGEYRKNIQKATKTPLDYSKLISVSPQKFDQDSSFATIWLNRAQSASEEWKRQPVYLRLNSTHLYNRKPIVKRRDAKYDRVKVEASLAVRNVYDDEANLQSLDDFLVKECTRLWPKDYTLQGVELSIRPSIRRMGGDSLEETINSRFNVSWPAKEDYIEARINGKDGCKVTIDQFNTLLCHEHVHVDTIVQASAWARKLDGASDEHVKAQVGFSFTLKKIIVRVVLKVVTSALQQLISSLTGEFGDEEEEEEAAYVYDENEVYADDSQ